MNKCKVCQKECTGKTCSGACRAKLSRMSKRTLEHQDSAQIHGARSSVTHDIEDGPVAVGRHDPVPDFCVNLEDGGVGAFLHYTSNPDMYIERCEPDKLNWGKWMNRVELERYSFKANRVSIPGDWDYRKVG